MPYVVIDESEAGIEAHDWQKVYVFASQNEAVDHATKLAAQYAPNAFDVAEIILRVQCPVGEPTVTRVA